MKNYFAQTNFFVEKICLVEKNFVSEKFFDPKKYSTCHKIEDRFNPWVCVRDLPPRSIVGLTSLRAIKNF